MRIGSNPFRVRVPMAFGLTMLALSGPVHADVTLASSDGRWVAMIEDAGGAAGQCTGLRDTNLPPTQQSFLVNTRHYLRIGNALTYPNALTQRVEDSFQLISFANSADTYTAVLASGTNSGVIAIVHGEMVSGAAGGLRVSVSFQDTDPPASVLQQLSVKPFVYANMNCDGQMLNNYGGWTTDHFHQSTGGAYVRNFIGRNPTSYMSLFNSFLQDALDEGQTDLSNTTVGGPGDINTAMGFAALGLGSGQTQSIAYAVGNASIGIPANFGMAPTVGAVGISSDDHRWSATVRTGLDYTDFGSAGEVTSVLDFNEPLAQAQFATLATYYLGVSSNTSFSGQLFKNAFKRVAFFYPSENTSMFSAVLNSKNHPGLVMIVDGKMISGDQGGLVVCLKFADTLGRGLNIAAAAYADMDVNGQTDNVGGWNNDHFWQSTTGAPHINWFRAASYGSYFSNLNTNVQMQMNQGLVVLPNTLYGGTGNIGTAFGFEPWKLQQQQPYVTGFALGNPNIDIPTSFVFPSVWFTCPADIAPAPQGDGLVNVSDLLAVITAWGSCPAAPAACDSDIVPHYVGDGAVNVSDLLEVITHWGQCFAK